MLQKECFCSYDTLRSAIDEHGLPIELEAAGSGMSVQIRDTSEISNETQKILKHAAVMGNGVVIKDD
ncbi:hypothetical protein JXR01_02215 [Candidatus Kaiserbacteria bacterium]|nr:MAG: hypothetical protein JXR01_02215 [Candidatus Kaiserbacteria bacterium]